MLVIKVDTVNPELGAIKTAADAIRRGELVIFPTETVYGLAADALNESAVRRVFEAKDRFEGHPLPVQVAGVEQLHTVAASIPESARLLAERYWPGPLTLVLPKTDEISDLVSGGRDTVGVRVPDHPVALALLRELNSPIVASSANISGKDAATDATAAARELEKWVSVTLDAGESKIGVASTVIDVSVTPHVILRQGAISRAEIVEMIGDVEIAD
ncbi:MAG: L-threonylcarbamoyladenylate synthase [Armatimonadota bacterium]|nr:threonylcarbamoyl-AMP synthase [bacterium]